tara:strand:- start:17539 stop:18741 length:1203 start_codon:yes stop_codon:yes gene_type:complete
MRILQIFNRYVQEGGEQQAVQETGSGLAPEHEVKTLLFDTRDWEGKNGVGQKVQQALAMVWNPKSIRTAKETIDEFRPDVIVLHNMMPVGSAALLYWLTRQAIPVVQYIHNFRPFSVSGYLWAGDQVERAGLRLNFIPEIKDGAWQDSRVKTLWYAMILWGLHALGVWKKMTHWIAISQFMKETFAEAGIPADKVSVVKHAWQPLEELVPRTSFEASMPFVFLGRLSAQKGIGTLLEAWTQVEKASPEAKLVICGEGPMEKAVRDFAEGRDHVTYRGFVRGEKKEALLRGARCLLAPSIWYEGLGLVAYDGYEYGLPVVAAKSGGLAEIVMNDETGFLIPPGDSKALANGIVKMLGLPDGGVAMGLQGRKWLEKSATREQWKKEMLSVFTKLHSNSGNLN